MAYEQMTWPQAAREAANEASTTLTAKLFRPYIKFRAKRESKKWRAAHTVPAVGEIWWAWVAFKGKEDDPEAGKDRPCLVLEVNGDGTCLVWHITTRDQSTRFGYVRSYIPNGGGGRVCWLDTTCLSHARGFRKYIIVAPEHIRLAAENAGFTFPVGEGVR